MSQLYVQTIAGLYDAFNRGDLATLEQGISRDIRWNEAENSLYCGGNPYMSFADIRGGVFDPIGRDFDGFRCDVEQYYDAGETVIGTGRCSGRSKATGKELSAQFCHVMHLDIDGKLDRVQIYMDTLAVAQVTGQTQQLEEMKIPILIM